MSVIVKKRDIKEILTKEDERFRLIQLGFFSDINNEADFICKYFADIQGDTFSQWKSKILREYYRMKGFSIFCRNNIDDINFERMVKALFKEILRYFYKTHELTHTDKYLAPDNDSISYSLSKETFDFLYATRFSNICSFGNTSDLYNFCNGIITESFPLSEEVVLERLQDNDRFFWSKFYIKLRPIVAGFSYKISGTYGDNNIHDIWSDTCCTINQAVVGKIIEKPVTPKSILSYAIGIIKNKNREINRGKKGTKIEIETINYRLADSVEKNFFDNPSSIPANFPSQDEKISNYIDTQDKESVRCYMVVVLYNKEHPLHKKLIEGLEDKVQLLFEHYLDGLSYEDMVVKHYGEVSEEKMMKISATMRQNIKRVKEKLVSRFNEMAKI